LVRIHVGPIASTTYVDLGYDIDGRLKALTPVVDGVPDSARIVQLVHDGPALTGADGAVCEACHGERRRFYFDAAGLLVRVTNSDGQDLETREYDGAGRLSVLRRLSSNDEMVVTRRNTYDAGPDGTTIVTVHEPVSDVEERIRIEHYDARGRNIQLDQFTDLFPLDSNPSGEVLTRTRRYTDAADDQAIRTEIVEETDPAGVKLVTATRTYPDGLPIFLSVGTEGWRLPRGAFQLAGMQPGDAAFTPLVLGATATAGLEVAESGTFYPAALLHKPKSTAPGGGICIELQVELAEQTFVPGYASLHVGTTRGWSGLFDACETVGQAGHEHPGWSLVSGNSYRLRLAVVRLVPSPNAASGWGIDEFSLGSVDSDPASLPVSPYVPLSGKARYLRRYRLGTDGTVAKSTIALAGFAPFLSRFQTLLEIDERNGVHEYTYDSAGLLTAEVGPETLLLDQNVIVRPTTTYAYDENRRLTLTGRSNAQGSMTYEQRRYDLYGHLIGIVENSAGNPSEQASTLFTYNIYGERTSVTDACGSVTASSYGPAGKVVDEVVYQGGATGNVLKQTHYEYDADYRMSVQRVARDQAAFPIGMYAAWSDTTFAYDRAGRLIRQTGPDIGVGPLVRSLAYDYQDQVIEEHTPAGAVHRKEYDGLGRVRWSTLEGNDVTPLVWVREFDGAGRLSQAIQPDKGVEEYEYDSHGRRRAVMNAARVEYSYDDADQIVQRRTIDSDSQQVVEDHVYDFDGLGRKIRERHRLAPDVDGPRDELTLHAYDGGGRLTLEVRKADGNLDESRFEPGDEVEHADFDALDRRISRRVGYAGEAVRTDYVPSLCGQVLQSVVDPGGLNVTTIYAYDAARRRVQVIDPEQTSTVTAYDSQDHVIEETWRDANGQVVSRRIAEYNAAGQVTRSATLANPLAAVVSLQTDSVEDRTYNSRGFLAQIIRHVDGQPRILSFEYDGIGRRVVARLPGNPETDSTAVSFDPATGLISEIRRSDSLGILSTVLTYDEFGRRTQARRVGLGPDTDRVTRYTYDAVGRTVGLEGSDGKIASRQFDLAGRIEEWQESGAGLTRSQSFRHGRVGHVTSITVNADVPQTTLHEYDSAGRPHALVASDQARTEYRYDAAGRILRKRDPRGFFVHYAHDLRGQLLHRSVSDAGFEPFWVSDVFAYDAMGRVVLAQRDAQNQTAMEYNGLGHVLRQKQTVDGLEKSIEFGRNQVGERVSMTIPQGPSLTYSYDALGQVSGVTRDGALLLTYLHAGRFPTRRTTHTTSGKTLDLELAYNSFREVIGMANLTDNQATELLSFSMERDVVGNVEAETMASTAEVLQSVEYTYDGLHKLSTAEYTGSIQGTESFDIDLLANRRTYSGTGNVPMASSVNYTSGAANQYLTVGGTPVAHDAAGNLTVDEHGFRYAYDFANRVVEIRSPSDQVVAAYVYDALGRRVRSDIGGQLTLYYYDDQHKVLAEYDQAGVVRRYFVDGSAYVDEHAVVRDQGAGRDYYYLLRNNYTVAGLADADAKIVERYAYNAYGGVRVHTSIGPHGDADNDFDVDLHDFQRFQNCMSAPANPGCAELDVDSSGIVDLGDFPAFLGCMAGTANVAGTSACFGSNDQSPRNPYFYSGRNLDVIGGGQSVSLYWHRNRYYSPEHGRWLSRDPLGLREGPNLYEYAKSAPGRLVDPDGMVSVTVSTPWGDVSVGDGCGSISTSEDESKDWFFFGGKLKASLEIEAEIKGEVCKKCCKKPTPRAGEEVYEISVSGTITGTGTLAFRPWGIHEEFWLVEVEGWLGLEVAGSLSGSGSGTLSTDLCNNQYLKGSVCAEVGGAVRVSGGGELSVTYLGDEDAGEEEEDLFSTSATVSGEVGVVGKTCYECPGGVCEWTPWRVCATGTISAEFKVYDYGVSVDLLEGKVGECDDD
jgi:RHS repeat-associated protein